MVITRELTEAARASTAIGIELGECVTEIGEGAFSGYTNLGDFDLPESVIRIDRGAFKSSSITSIDLPSGLTSIGTYAFRNCTSLSSVTLPNSTTSISPYSFANCSGLTSIYVMPTSPPSVASTSFSGTTCPIYIPSQTYDAYSTANGWIKYADRLYEM